MVHRSNGCGERDAGSLFRVISDENEICAVVFEPCNAGRTVGYIRDLVAGALEHHANRRAHEFLVIDQENPRHLLMLSGGRHTSVRWVVTSVAARPWST